MQKYLHKNQMIMLLDRRTLTLVFIVCVCFPHIVYSQPKLSITPEPVGSGARALGQSAFIAVADDATAASWNPAGLIQLERPEASFVGAWRSITKDYSPEITDVLMGRDNWSESEINFMSYAQPIEIWNKDMVISVNYHQVYDFGIKYNGVVKEGTDVYTLKGKSEGSVSAYSLASGLSMPFHPEITIGASFNWYAQSLLNDYAWKVKQRWEKDRAPLPPGWGEIIETFDDFRGQNFTFGLLWDVYEKQENLLTLGLVYHTPFTAKVDGEKITSTRSTPKPIFDSQSMDIDFPASLGAGLNYRISDKLSVAFDVEWKEWSNFEQKDRDSGERKSPIDKDTLAYRLGFEHLAFLESASESVLAYRGGLFYEPRPVSNFPDPLEIYGFGAGLGWTVMDQFSLDFAYQYRWGDQDIGDIDYDLKEHFFIASLIIYF